MLVSGVINKSVCTINKKPVKRKIIFWLLSLIGRTRTETVDLLVYCIAKMIYHDDSDIGAF